jgi:hypothetical protein
MDQILRRALGVVIILVGLVGLGVGSYGVFWLQDVAAEAERDLVSVMDNGLEGLEVISDTLVLLVQTVDDAGTVLDAAAESSRSAGGTVEAIRPAVTEMSDVVAVDLPNNIEKIQDAMPALQEASAAIDKTLRSLADFQWRATIPLINYPLEFGLGIEYDPPVPLDQSVAEMDAALDQLPGQLMGIQSSLLETDLALGETADSMEAMGDSMATVQEDLDETAEVLAEYRELVAGATDTVRSVRRDLRDRIEGIRLTVTGILVWLVLSQLAPLYLGATLLVGRTPTKEQTR